MSVYVQTNQIILMPDDNTTISENDTGKHLMCKQVTVANKTYTLPAPASGLHYKFVNGSVAALNFSITITPNGGAAIFYGMSRGGPIDGVSFTPLSANTQITFLAFNSVIGDFIDLISDGTNWYAHCESSSANGFFIV